jgi:hypothetical protein
MESTMRRLWVILVAVSIAGCDLVGADCKTYLAAGIALTVVDASSGEAVHDRHGVIRAISGNYADTMAVGPNDLRYGQPFLLAFEKPGTYRVEVEVDGYDAWQRDDIRVRKENECHVRTVELQADLQPST